MKYYWIILLIGLMACGNLGTNKSDVKVTKTETDQHIYEYQWHKSVSEYQGKKIEVYGFIYLDSIQPFLQQGTYKILERPNGYECGEVEAKADTDISMVMIDDTTFENTNQAAQWRLAKVTGIVDNYQYLTIERVELAEYSYPDYENSGFVEVNNEYLQNEQKMREHVYLDGYIKSKKLSTSNDYISIPITGTGLQEELWVCIKKGSGANQIETSRNTGSLFDLKVRDKNGNIIRGKKVRVYGIWNTMPISNNQVTRGIYVEMINSEMK